MTIFWKIAIAIGVVGALIFGYRKYEDALAAKAIAELQLSEQITLRKATEARYASSALVKDSLEEALKSAKKINGDLVAALRIRVPARETTIVHTVDSLGTDSTRYASFTDSTFAGIISGFVEAPPCCAPLTVGYNLFRPTFSPTVAFIQKGDSTVATVTWNGEHVEIVAPYANLPKKQKKLGYWGEIRYRFPTWELQGGVYARVPLVQLTAGISSDKEAFVGVRKEF